MKFDYVKRLSALLLAEQSPQTSPSTDLKMGPGA
jgi:hypothetical protein